MLKGHIGIIFLFLFFVLALFSCKLPEEQNIESVPLDPQVKTELQKLEQLSYDYFTSNPDSAEIVLYNTIEFLDSLNIPYEKFYTYMRFSQLYQYHKPDFYKAITKLGKALKIFVEHPGEYNSNPFVYINIGNIFYHYGFYDHAREFYQIALRFSDAENIDWGKALSLQNIALSFQEIQMYDSALVYLERAEKIAKYRDDFLLMHAQNHSYMTYLSYIRKDSLRFADLEFHANMVFDLYEIRQEQPPQLRVNISDVTWKKHLARAHRTLSNFYFLKGNNSIARNHLDSAFIFSLQAGSKKLMAQNELIQIVQNESFWTDLQLMEEVDHVHKIFETIPDLFAKKEFADSMITIFERRGMPGLHNYYADYRQIIADSISMQKLSDDFTTNLMLMSRISAEYNLQRSQLLGVFQEKTIRIQNRLIIFFILLVIIVITSFIIFVFQRRKIEVANKAMYGRIKQDVRRDIFIQEENGNGNGENTKVKERQEIFDRFDSEISKIMKEQKPYLQKDISLNNLAALLNTNQTYLSSYLNKRQNANFNDFINQYRIKEACRLILEKDNDKYTTEMLGQLSGFNSTSTFYAAFKKFTGMSPSAFKNNRE